jgi:hypothetical protein
MRDHVDGANLALLFVIPVLLGALTGGRWAGVGSAVAATMCFDFFLTRPYLSLRIDSADDVETLVLFAVVALIAAELGIRSRRLQAESHEAKSELARLRRVADVSARGADGEDIVLSVCAELVGLFGLTDCEYVAGANDALIPTLGRGGAMLDAPLVIGSRGFELPAGLTAIEVLGRGKVVGSLVMHAPRGISTTLEQRVVAVALADQLGMALVSEQQKGAS